MLESASGGGVCSGGVLRAQGGFSLPGGAFWSGGVSTLGGSGPREGVYLPGGAFLVRGGCSGGVWSRGGSAPGGSPCPETPPVNRITHTCKNITLATTSLRPVTRTYTTILYHVISFSFDIDQNANLLSINFRTLRKRFQ